MGKQGLKKQFELLANYNQWMNTALFTVVSGLDPVELAKDRGAFFGSILGTLNHALVGDTLWLKRFAAHPANYKALKPLDKLTSPATLSTILHSDISHLKAARETMDAVLILFTKEAADKDYAHPLSYTNTEGKTHKKLFGSLVQHLFNHQTHHRGQVSTLLNQQGINIDSTDLLMLIPDA